MVYNCEYYRIFSRSCNTLRTRKCNLDIKKMKGYCHVNIMKSLSRYNNSYSILCHDIIKRRQISNLQWLPSNSDIYRKTKLKLKDI